MPEYPHHDRHGSPHLVEGSSFVGVSGDTEDYGFTYTLDLRYNERTGGGSFVFNRAALEGLGRAVAELLAEGRVLHVVPGTPPDHVGIWMRKREAEKAKLPPPPPPCTHPALEEADAYQCEECENVNASVEEGPLYECGTCGAFGVGADERRCSTCNRFMARVSESTDICEDCRESVAVAVRVRVCTTCREYIGLVEEAASA